MLDQSGVQAAQCFLAVFADDPLGRVAGISNTESILK